MHGNTRSAQGGIKTRHIVDIVSEISSSLRIHSSLSSNLGGIHLELTGDITPDGFSVTECIGGSMELAEEELGLRFESFCDPRLNFEQSLDIAFMLGSHGREEGRGRKSGLDRVGVNPIVEGLTKDGSRPGSLAR